jgi:hypothetical protein
MAAHFLTVLPGANDNEKLTALCKLTYKEQGVWFLNAFWEGGLPSGRLGDHVRKEMNFV